jgi:excisionase family DNA binding protein
MSKNQEYTAIEAARLLGVGLDYLYGLLWTGKLEGQKVGRKWSIPATAVDARLKQREATNQR